MKALDNLIDELGGTDEIAVSTRLFQMMREGLLNGVAVPEVQTEAEMAAHQLLGCDRYAALLSVYHQADDIDRDPAFGPIVANLIQDMADRRLREFATAIVEQREPLGAHHCIGKETS